MLAATLALESAIRRGGEVLAAHGLLVVRVEARVTMTAEGGSEEGEVKAFSTSDLLRGEPGEMIVYQRRDNCLLAME